MEEIITYTITFQSVTAVNDEMICTVRRIVCPRVGEIVWMHTCSEEIQERCKRLYNTTRFRVAIVYHYINDGSNYNASHIMVTPLLDGDIDRMI